MAFLFVDRITDLDTTSAVGWLDLGRGGTAVPPWLAIEAVGQLAAWIAMARSDFALRPVAALVGEVRIGEAAGGARVALAARIDRFDGRAILYSGTASAAGATVTELSRCVGPLLPMEVFDDPAAVRARLALLRSESGAPPAASHELPRVALDGAVGGEDGWRAALHIPPAAPFFADHFPRRAVYPATLLAEAQSQLARPVAAAALGLAPERIRIRRVHDFKVRAFSAPGQSLALAARPHAVANEGATVAVSATFEGKRIASGLIECGVRS